MTKITLRAPIKGQSDVWIFYINNTKYRLYYNINGLIELHYYNKTLKKLLVCVSPPPAVQDKVKEIIDIHELGQLN